jgi:UV DNA damage endonuclease
MRLGFAVKVLGRPGLKSNDSRRWRNAPHLRVSIEYAHAIFDYLAETKITMYRLSSDFAPYLSHPELPQFHRQLEEAEADLVALGARARALNLRLSFHPSQYILLNSPNEALTQTSMRDINAQATMLDLMEQGNEAVVVTHVGGVYGDRDAARQRFVERHRQLPEPAQRRLVLENDDTSWGVDDVLRIHEQTGIRCVFDHQHHGCINPDGSDAVAACCAMLKTWPDGCRPKIHFSSPRVEPRIVERRDKASGKRQRHEVAPLASQHADYIDASVFVPFMRAVAHDCSVAGGGSARDSSAGDSSMGGGTIPFDVMCEAKSKDLAVLRLRDDLQRMAPEVVTS